MSNDELLFNGQVRSIKLANSSHIATRDDPIEKALMELRENFVLKNFHEERVRKLLENDESLLDDLNHLVIAASLMISDGSQMEAGSLKSYEMGDKIIIEEETDDGWQVARTVGIQVAQILGHARALKRIQELEDLVGGLGSDPLDRLDEIKEPPLVPNSEDPAPHTRPSWRRDDITWSDNIRLDTSELDDDVRMSNAFDMDSEEFDERYRAESSDDD